MPAERGAVWFWYIVRSGSDKSCISAGARGEHLKRQTAAREVSHDQFVLNEDLSEEDIVERLGWQRF